MASQHLQDKVLIQNTYNKIVKDNIENTNIHKYLESMDETEIHALVVSKIILESSFSLEKSIGFLESPYSKKN